MAQAYPILPTCISRAGARVRPKRSPCNKPLHLPSSKDSIPSLPAIRPPRSCLSVPNSVSHLPSVASPFSDSTGNPGSVLLLWLVEILGPRMDKGAQSWVTWSLALKLHALFPGGTDRHGQTIA